MAPARRAAARRGAAVPSRGGRPPPPPPRPWRPRLVADGSVELCAPAPALPWRRIVRVKSVGDSNGASLPRHDPRYAPILVRSTPAHGRVAVRPLSPPRVPAAATALAAAFADDAEPPTRAWLVKELTREAARYEKDPSPWTEGRVRLPVEPWPGATQRATLAAAAPPPALTIPSALRAFSSSDDDNPLASSSDDDATASHPADWRVRVEEAWGRWLWLEAAAVCGEDESKPPAADAPCLGAAAVLFHDRAASLAALARLKNDHAPLSSSASAAASSAALDWGLWLRDAPPPAWPPRRAALLWWVGVPPAARRAGVGSALVAAAEAVAAGAGFPRVAVQANRVDGAAPTGVAALVAALSPPRSRPRPAGRALYEAVGYAPPPAPPLAASGGAVDRSAVLLTKWCGGAEEGGDDPWLL